MAVQTRTIDYADGAAALEGYFAWDDAASGPRPGVLIVRMGRPQPVRRRCRAQTGRSRLHGTGDGRLWQRGTGR